MSAPFLKAGAVIPGRWGVVSEQMYLHTTKKARSQSALEEFDAALDKLSSGSLCLDLGANVGEFTERMALTGAEVHAFEPDPWAFKQLRSRCGGMPNVHLHNAAVAAEKGTLRLFRASDQEIEENPLRTYGSTTISGGRNDRSSSIEVESIDFCDFVLGLPRIVNVVKMDIEGAEVAVLEALLASSALERIEKIFVETHYHMYVEQVVPVATLRKAFLKVPQPDVNFDWP